MLPRAAPRKAPKPMGRPDRTVYMKAFDFENPPALIGTAIEIPSGMSCITITAVIVRPRLIETSKPEPTAKPSGKL
jgi:hypothetical protein